MCIKTNPLVSCFHFMNKTHEKSSKREEKETFSGRSMKKRNGEEGKQQIPILMAVTLSPQALRMRPILLAVTPFPSPLTTPPVTKTYFIFIFSALLPHFRITKETDNLPFLEYLPSKNSHNDKKKKIKFLNQLFHQRNHVH